MQRPSGREPGQLRDIAITRNFTCHAEGSVLVSFGKTRVICTATVEQGVPRFMRGEGRGWVTAEYAMLPTATSERMQRESVKGKLGGRTYEIQRLIGRSLRAIVDMEALGERQINVDCDVLQADGGTRTLAITGAWAALALAGKRLRAEKVVKKNVVAAQIAAGLFVTLYTLSVGVQSAWHPSSFKLLPSSQTSPVSTTLSPQPGMTQLNRQASGVRSELATPSSSMARQSAVMPARASPAPCWRRRWA